MFELSSKLATSLDLWNGNKYNISRIIGLFNYKLNISKIDDLFKFRFRFDFDLWYEWWQWMKELIVFQYMRRVRVLLYMSEWKYKTGWTIITELNE